MSKKVVVIYSGGMDSYTVLHKAIEEGLTPFALTFDYGQRHVKEIQMASEVCESLNINHKIIDITAINQLIGGSSLTDSSIEVATGDYDNNNMVNTVVPNRNMILLSLAVGYAVSIGAEKVYYGAHSGDHEIYPDCRPIFVEKMNEVAAVANYEKTEIHSPYLKSDKVGILKDGLRMGLDYSKTWTCYNGREKACGECGSCKERLEAFAKNGLSDPISYEA
ncbi:7-cyano-7-deazaguanine synthase QueC [Psychromonas sp. 14N.309.X.WAT.B.A12]|uniref:7-cyano-7-deazaguanine synthase QueC n=1 Tax=unclassified Psychromonas TaxID=2614957 RepID=UPI0025B09A7C|nr:7-cyano-7-deazaguanine synthase QueC [Psychromonas sp. 14N.309.X.WAT.B.A12]MDN2663746.1 7-cyano-7-deazaguanine synthase QueC [Psychromonas sp. 14N.309.X.WAT.B.A12]